MNHPSDDLLRRAESILRPADKPRRRIKTKLSNPHKADCQCTPCLGEKEALTRAARAGWPIVESKTEFDQALEDADPKGLGPMYVDLPPLVRENRSARARVAEFLAHKASGIKTTAEIAKKMGLRPEYLSGLLWKAGKEGWLVYSNPAERFEHEIMPNVVDNVAHFIKQKDRTMTIEAAKGGGLFKSHQAVKVEHDQPNTVLALKIETAPQSEPQIVVGTIVGRPKGELKE